MKNLYICAMLASLGGLLSGYDTGVISGALLYIEKSFPITPNLVGMLVGCVSIGAVVGALINGFIIDKIGRKLTLLVCALIFFFGSIFCYFSNNIFHLIISRTLIGMAVGIVSFAVPLYLSEISTKEKRGQIVSFFQVAITFGILFSYMSNFYLAQFENNWRYMLLIGIIPAFVMFFGILLQNDTPRWLVLKGKIEEAENILLKFNKNANITNEIEEIKSTLTVEHLKFSKKLIKPFVIGLGIMMVQILTGINAIIYFAPIIFKKIGFSNNSDVLLITVFIGLINFLMTFVATAFSDKIGRKPLLYIGLTGMLLNLIILAFSFESNILLVKYLGVISCSAYIIFFSMSLGPIALLLISEIFPLKFRGLAMSFAIITNFICNFIVTSLFPICLSNFGGKVTFLIFAVNCLISLVFVKVFIFETKEKSLEEIEKTYS